MLLVVVGSAACGCFSLVLARVLACVCVCLFVCLCVCVFVCFACFVCVCLSWFSRLPRFLARWLTNFAHEARVAAVDRD